MRGSSSSCHSNRRLPLCHPLTGFLHPFSILFSPFPDPLFAALHEGVACFHPSPTSNLSFPLSTSSTTLLPLQFPLHLVCRFTQIRNHLGKGKMRGGESPLRFCYPTDILKQRFLLGSTRAKEGHRRWQHL